MRIHVTANGKHTSISVDETLLDYLGARMVQKRPKLHTNAQRQLELAKAQIQEFVRESRTLPEKNLSQYVQSMIVEQIINPELQTILDARGPRHIPAKIKSTGGASNPADMDRAMNDLLALTGKAARA